MKVIASFATVPERRALSPKTTESLARQTDKVVAYENKAWGTLPGDYAKFIPIGQEECDYFFTCDDDIQYPPDYAASMIQFSAMHSDCVVTAHGRLFTGANQTSYYRGLDSKYHFRGTVTSGVAVDVPGSGVTCIPERLHGPMSELISVPEIPNAADLYLAIMLKQLGERAVVIPHRQGWIDVHPGQYRTIYHDIVHHNGDESVQVRMLNEVLA